VRLELHVRPGASSTAVGGTHDGALVVRVVEPADAGRATEAALTAVARAVGIPRRSVTLVRGATSRRKLIDLDAGSDGPEVLGTTVEQLLRRGRVDG
jgi:uncharacterized protein YggU (UPF0235/DUF167 family)